MGAIGLAATGALSAAAPALLGGGSSPAAAPSDAIRTKDDVSLPKGGPTGPVAVLPRSAPLNADLVAVLKT